MRRLIEFLQANPILVFILLAWIAGIVGNMMRAVRKAASQRGVPPSPPPLRRPREGAAGADDVAAEMRRILGLPPEAPGEARSQPRPQRREAPVPRRPVEVERPPQPVVPTTQQRRLEIHVDPHVGDAIKKREAKPATATVRAEIGSLGGRSPLHQRRREAAHRFPLSDLRTAFVLSEILGPPVAARPPASH